MKHLSVISRGGQGPILYEDIAHVILPHHFSEEYHYSSHGPESDCVSAYTWWEHEQNIGLLSKKLKQAGIEHNYGGSFLEIRRY